MVKIKKKLKTKTTKPKLIKAKAKPVKPTNERSLAKVSVDDFLSKDFDSSDSGNDLGLSDEDDLVKERLNSEEEDAASEAASEDVDERKAVGEDDDEDEEDGGSEDEGGEDELAAHKQSLSKLKETDPEFYKFLQDNDKKLLDFNLSDSDDDQDGDDEEKVHIPRGDLEVASDESDFEADGDEGRVVDDRVITLKMLKGWQNEIRTDKSNKTINCLMRAFNAAVCRVSSEEDQQASYYKVEGTAVFNGVIQLCVLELGPAVRKFLGIAPGSKQPPHKCKKFVKIKTPLGGYFADLLKILNGVTSSNILTVLLKHLHYMCPMIVSFGKETKPLLKKLIGLWGTSDETVRVVSFLCILRITNNQQQNLLDNVLKMMYMTYVKNSKFVSTNALPSVNFMRRSLVEMFALDLNVTYQHVFLYVRQLAIHLRNAITVNKKENVQAVYNWQFVNSLRLWGNLLSATCNKPQLQPLVYPFVQVCLGTVKLVPTAQYYPLRFHVVQILMDLSKDVGVFIPILPFLLEVLTTYDFNKKHQKASMKPLHFTCLLRLSKSQLSENGFKDRVIDTIYGQLLEYLANKSYSIAFPDLSLLCTIQLKQFVKKCSISNYCRKMRQLLEKIEQNNKFVINERKTVTFTLKDAKLIEAWETALKNKGTPLSTYYESWNKMRNVKKSKQATDNEAIGDYNLPVLKKAKKGAAKAGKDDKVVLFPSDSESDTDTRLDESSSKKPRRGKRGGKNVNKRPIVIDSVQDDDGLEQDIVEDLKVTDW